MMSDTDDENVDKAAAAQAAAAQGPLTWSRWRHYKGGIYAVIACAVDEATLEPVVVYRGEARRHLWTRPLAAWTEVVEHDGARVPRFEEIK